MYPINPFSAYFGRTPMNPKTAATAQAPLVQPQFSGPSDRFRASRAREEAQRARKQAEDHRAKAKTLARGKRNLAKDDHKAHRAAVQLIDYHENQADIWTRQAERLIQQAQQLEAA